MNRQGKRFEGIGLELMEILTWNMPGSIEKYAETMAQDTLCPG
jgi:hypothetical protein